MDYLVAALVGIAISISAVWVCVAATLLILRPDRAALAAAARFPRDLVGFVRRLAADPDLPRGARIRLRILLIYLVIPIDLIPDFVPVIGYADDVLITLLLLRGVMRTAGEERIAEDWHGDPRGLEAMRRLCGLPDAE